MTDDKQTILIHRYLTGQMPRDEELRFEERLRDDPDFAVRVSEVSSVWSQSADYQGMVFDSDRAWRKFTRAGNRPITTHIRPMRLVGVAAAVLVLCLLAWQGYVTLLRPAQFVALESSLGMVTLEDGSLVALREGSQMSVPRAFAPRHRTVRLSSGAVFLEVNPDEKRPFIVETPWAVIRVTGTAFGLSVDTTADLLLLRVTEGSVSFEPADSREVIVVQDGHGISFNARTRIVERLRRGDNNELSWHTGVLSFREAPLGEVFDDIARHYGIRIDRSALAVPACRFTAPLPYRDVPYTVILDALHTAFDVRIAELSDREYVVSGGVCRR